MGLARGKFGHIVDRPELNEAAALRALMALFRFSQSIPNIGLVAASLDLNRDDIAVRFLRRLLDNAKRLLEIKASKRFQRRGHSHLETRGG